MPGQDAMPTDSYGNFGLAGLNPDLAAEAQQT